MRSLSYLIYVTIFAIAVYFIAVEINGHFSKREMSSNQKKAIIDIIALEHALDKYKLDNEVYPPVKKSANASDKPKDITRKITKKDPWGNDYQIIEPGQRGDIDIFSFGADGKAGGEGEDLDIGNWSIK